MRFCFLFFAQKIDFEYSFKLFNGAILMTEYPHLPSTYAKNKNNDVYPCKPQFHYIKVRFEGV